MAHGTPASLNKISKKEKPSVVEKRNYPILDRINSLSPILDKLLLVDCMTQILAGHKIISFFELLTFNSYIQYVLTLSECRINAMSSLCQPADRFRKHRCCRHAVSSLTIVGHVLQQQQRCRV